MIAKQSTRKSRTKLRKPKYLSLRLQLTPPPMPPTNHHDHKQQLNLFPLHPENLVEQDKLDEEPIMARMFSSCDDVDGAATTLTGILCTEAKDEKEDNVHDTNNVPSPSSVADEEVELVRTAMRRNKTDKVHDQEKWVCYSEVVDRKKAVREISSSSSTTTASCRRQTSNSNSNSNNNRHPLRNKLVLKLDYEKIMESWVNKGPLYISDVDAPQPQTVPDLQDDHDFFLPSSINVKTHGEQDNGGNGGSWTVPQMTHIENNGISRGDDALQAGESSPVAHPHNREASVQRYKEKRRNRLFAKTVRYEVRKLNAEKRPRVKGRFVKSN